MKKTYGNLLLFLLASRKEHELFARAKALELLTKKRGLLINNENGEFTLTEKALSQLSKMYDIKFNAPTEDAKTEEGADE